MHPIVVALTGSPGTGKSRLGASLYRRLPRDFAFLDIDTLTQPLVRAALAINGLGLSSAAENGTLRVLRDAQYACLFDQVRQLVSLGRNVLFVAPMTHELDDPSAFSGVVESLRPAHFILIRLRAPADTVRERLARRRDFLDELRLARWDADRVRYDRPQPLPICGLDLDSSDRTPTSLADEALRWLGPQLVGSQRGGDREANPVATVRMRA